MFCLVLSGEGIILCKCKFVPLCKVGTGQGKVCFDIFWHATVPVELSPLLESRVSHLLVCESSDCCFRFFLFFDV